MSMLISDKIDFKTNIDLRDKDYIKGSVHQEDKQQL